jgi:hypothetical protein
LRTAGGSGLQAERASQFLHHLRRKRCGRGSDEPQLRARRFGVVTGGAREDRLVDRRDGRVPGRTHLVEPAEELEPVEPARAAHPSARGERREHRRDQPVDVEERHHVQAHVVGTEPERGHDVARGRGEISLQERDDLRPRRRPGGVQHESDVVGLGESARGRNRGG